MKLLLVPLVIFFGIVCAILVFEFEESNIVRQQKLIEGNFYFEEPDSVKVIDKDTGVVTYDFIDSVWIIIEGE